MSTNDAGRFVADWQANVARLVHTYDPAQEHDACGVGLVASLDGSARREVVEAGIAALRNLWHRGAVDADGKTGDGAGIHVEIPHEFFADAIRHAGHELQPGLVAVGQIFMPKTDLGAQERCRQIVETEILAFGYTIYGWRQVPVNISQIGEKANATRPEIEQVLLYDPQERPAETVDRDLYICRRRIEKRALADNITELYVC